MPGPPTVNDLPAEVLSDILVLAISSHNPCGCLFPLRLDSDSTRGVGIPLRSPPEPFGFGRVSRYWREVARSTPRLWNLLLIDISDPAGPQAVIAGLENRIALSGDVPLILGINLESPIRRPQPYVVEFVQRHANRWGEIYAKVDWWPDIFEGSRVHFSNLSVLAAVRSANPQAALSVLKSELLPRLSRLGIMESEIPQSPEMHDRWGKLTVFEGMITSTTNLVDALRNAPSIIHIRVVQAPFARRSYSPFHTLRQWTPPSPDPDGADVATKNPSIATLPNLETLDVVCLRLGEFRMDALCIFRRLQAPALKLLRWCCAEPYTMSPTEEIRAFITDSQCKLDALFLQLTYPVGMVAVDPSITARVVLDEIPSLHPAHLIVFLTQNLDTSDTHGLWSHLEALCQCCYWSLSRVEHDCSTRVFHRNPTSYDLDHHNSSQCKICSV